MTTTAHGGERPRVPLFDTMNRIPGGLMLVPLVLGSVIGTFAGGALEIGSFTTGLFKDSALPLIALLIFTTGTQVTLRNSGPVLGTAGVVLLTKSLVPATLVVLLGLVVGVDGFLGIPVLALVAAIVPFLLGMVVGNLDSRWREVLRPVPNVVIPFFAFALGTGIDLGSVVTGGLSGIVIGVAVTLITGTFVYLGYRLLLRRGRQSGIGISAATTAGNAIATPGLVAAADPSFAPYVGTATAQVAASVLVTAILSPLLASWVLRRAGALDASSTGAP